MPMITTKSAIIFLIFSAFHCSTAQRQTRPPYLSSASPATGADKLIGDLFQLHHSPAVAAPSGTPGSHGAGPPLVTAKPPHTFAGPTAAPFSGATSIAKATSTWCSIAASPIPTAGPSPPGTSLADRLSLHPRDDPYSIQLNVPLAGPDTLVPAGIAKEIDLAAASSSDRRPVFPHLAGLQHRHLHLALHRHRVERRRPRMRPAPPVDHREAARVRREGAIEIPLDTARPGGPLTFSTVSVHRHPDWKGRLTGLRLHWINGDKPSSIFLRSIHTAVDSRHPITNSLFVRGSCDYFQWTGDLDFLRANLARMRRALGYAIREFTVEENGCVLVPWVGHGAAPASSGTRRETRPFSTAAASATTTMTSSPSVTRTATPPSISSTPSRPSPPSRNDRRPSRLEPSRPPRARRRQASLSRRKVRKTGQELFWNEENGRFNLHRHRRQELRLRLQLPQPRSRLLRLRKRRAGTNDPSVDRWRPCRRG